MAHVFALHKESLKRKFAVYVVVARGSDDIKLYVGKTGDNRKGCNPLISRCGNHFSYNDIHSQVRNKLDDHESRDYIYVFDHFDDYAEDETFRRRSVDSINEMERWLNQEIQKRSKNWTNITLLNPLSGINYVKKDEREKRTTFRTAENEKKIHALLEEVENQIAKYQL